MFSFSIYNYSYGITIKCCGAMSPTYVFCIIFSYSVQNSDRMVLGRRSGGSLSRIQNAPSDNVCGVAKNRHGHNRYHESCSRCGSSDLDRKDRQTDVRPTSALLIWTNGIHHDDVIKRNHFPRYWNFVRGNHRSPVHSPSQRPVTRSFDIFFDLCPNKRLSKQTRHRWSETPSRSL